MAGTSEAVSLPGARPQMILQFLSLSTVTVPSLVHELTSTAAICDRHAHSEKSVAMVSAVAISSPVHWVPMVVGRGMVTPLMRSSFGPRPVGYVRGSSRPRVSTKCSPSASHTSAQGIAQLPSTITSSTLARCTCCTSEYQPQRVATSCAAIRPSRSNGDDASDLMMPRSIAARSSFGSHVG